MRAEIRDADVKMGHDRVFYRINFDFPRFFFQDWIMEHYSEESANYENDLIELHDLRKVWKMPVLFFQISTTLPHPIHPLPI